MKVESIHLKNQRQKQEDALAYSEAAKVFCVCDGVGGSNHGEVASKLLSETLVSTFSDVKSIHFELFKEKVELAIDNYRNYSIENPMYTGMTTTMVFVAVSNSILFTAHAGDSRVILYSDWRKTYWKTDDHSVIQELLDTGVLIDEDEGQKHPLRNRITNAVICKTEQAKDFVEYNQIDLVAGDRILLGSDGVFECFTALEIKELLSDQGSSLFKIKQTIEDACIRKARDNASAILIEL